MGNNPEQSYNHGHNHVGTRMAYQKNDAQMTGVGRDSGFGEGGRPQSLSVSAFVSVWTQSTAWPRSSSCPLWNLLEILSPHMLDPSLAMEAGSCSLSDIHSFLPRIRSMLGTADALSLLFLQVFLINAQCHSPHSTAENAGPERAMCELKLHSTQALVPLDGGLDLRDHLEALGSGRCPGPFMPSVVLVQPCA